MISGRLDRRITLRNQTTTADDSGEMITTYADYATVFANVTQQGAREVFQGGKVSEVDCVFKLRYLSSIDETWEIVFDSDTYKITGKPKELGRQDGLEIMGKKQ